MQALYLAYKGPRIPWYAWLSATAMVGREFRPIGLIPDFMPIPAIWTTSFRSQSAWGSPYAWSHMKFSSSVANSYTLKDKLVNKTVATMVIV